TANVYDGSLPAFQALVDGVADLMLVFSDTGFDKKDWSPTNLKICKRGDWNTRMLIETVLSMLTTVCHFKTLSHRVLAFVCSRFAFIIVLFNLLVAWHDLKPDEHGFVHLSIADFSL